jgi:hypothetical protein
MVFRTLQELGHEKSVQLIDSELSSISLCSTLSNIDPQTSSRYNHPLRNIHLRRTNVVLVPQPSEDVNDPLRWPTWKKYFAFLNVCLLAFMTTGFISGFSPGLYLLSVEFKRDVSTTTGLILWPLLTSGLGVCVPLLP